MGIDCEFLASNVCDVDRVRAIPGVFEIYPPGDHILGHLTKWTITSTIRWVGPGYATDERRPRVATLVRALRELCTDLEYGGDNGVPFVPVTNELIAAIEGVEEWPDELL